MLWVWWLTTVFVSFSSRLYPLGEFFGSISFRNFSHKQACAPAAPSHFFLSRPSSHIPWGLAIGLLHHALASKYWRGFPLRIHSHYVTVPGMLLLFYLSTPPRSPIPLSFFRFWLCPLASFQLFFWGSKFGLPSLCWDHFWSMSNSHFRTRVLALLWLR